MLIDTHAHLFAEEFANDLPEVIERAKAVGVSRIYMPNIDLASVEAMLQTCRRYAGYCFPMIGLHPTSISTGFEEELSAIKRYLTPNHSFVAIGEVGLDFYWDKTYMNEQIKALHEQITWAIETRLPLVIHCRNAFDALYDCLKPYKEETLTGVFHCFTGSAEDAERFMEMDRFLFGVNGAATYKKSEIPAVLKAKIPLTRLLLETDAPYLPPTPYRGKRNETSYMVEVAKKVAEIYDQSIGEVERVTTENALRLFDSQTGAS